MSMLLAHPGSCSSGSGWMNPPEIHCGLLLALTLGFGPLKTKANEMYGSVQSRISPRSCTRLCLTCAPEAHLYPLIQINICCSQYNTKRDKLPHPPGHILCEFSEEGCPVPTPLPICWLWHLPKQRLCLHKTGLLNFEISSGGLGRSLLLSTAEGMLFARLCLSTSISQSEWWD